MTSQLRVSIFTDGGCKPNPGPGGWGAVLLFGEGKKKRKKELKGAEAEATNNRMELRAAIEALKSLEEAYEVVLTTDSQYLRKGVNRGRLQRLGGRHRPRLEQVVVGSSSSSSSSSK